MTGLALVVFPCGPTGLVCDSIDFNNDTSFFDPQDIDAFLSVYSEGPCIPESATCNDIDFNNDTSVRSVRHQQLPAGVCRRPPGTSASSKFASQA
ncbi:MAG: hypothetical protein U0640_02905 [Phycisphaerales bacterium]